ASSGGSSPARSPDWTTPATFLLSYPYHTVYAVSHGGHAHDENHADGSGDDGGGGLPAAGGARTPARGRPGGPLDRRARGPLVDARRPAGVGVAGGGPPGRGAVGQGQT